MNEELKPGKGCHLVVNGEMLEFVQHACWDLSLAYVECGDDSAYDESAKKHFQAIAKMLMNKSQEPTSKVGFSDLEWSVASDNFGDKLITYTTYPDGECRVTLILTKPKGTKSPELKLDIRPWIEY